MHPAAGALHAGGFLNGDLQSGELAAAAGGGIVGGGLGVQNVALTDDEKQQLEQENALQINIENEVLVVTGEHLLKDQIVHQQYAMAEQGRTQVLLDVSLTEELVQEGQIRELIRAIQDIRKKWDLPIHQYVTISILSDDETINWIKNYDGFLRKTILLQDVLYQVPMKTEHTITVQLLQSEVTVGFQL